MEDFNGMGEPKKVLFITAPIGSGHIRAAEAIKKSLTDLQPGIDAKIVNIFDFISFALGNAILKSYLKVLKYIPKAYGMAYGLGNTNKLALIGREFVSRYMSARMENFLMKYDPSAIVCTHATPAGMVAQLAKQGKLRIPSIAAITDFTVHRLWVYPEIDYYFVAHEGMRDMLADWGVTYSKSCAVGIPVDKEFSEICPGQRGINVDDESLKTILIMGGGAGVFPMDRIILACDQLNVNFRIFAVTGNNKSMFKRLCELQPRLNHQTEVFGFVNNVHELMATSDLLISKPGGMTIAEAACVGLPMIIFKPIPGQEEANTRYLEEKKAAIKAESLQDIEKLMQRLLQQSHELTLLKQNARRLSNPAAAQQIAEYILTNI